MQHQPPINFTRSLVFLFVLSLVLAIGFIYQSIQLYSLRKQVNSLTSELSSSTSALTSTVDQLASGFNSLTTEAQGISSSLLRTKENLDQVKTEVGGVAQSVGTISSTVGDLKKLAEVDPQLLKKYSKVYFMNENYVPAHLTTIPSEYTYSTARKEQVLSESWPFLKNLLDTAKANGIPLYVKSGYRSFAEQKTLKTSYSVLYGAGTANAFSADQGYSEHQLGTTVDFTTVGLGGGLSGFDKTEAYTWLKNNAYRHGFVLSYPKGNKYYIYEPWHWRFVGVRLATYLNGANLNFYDLDQRTIDKFLINTFDQQ